MQLIPCNLLQVIQTRFQISHVMSKNTYKSSLPDSEIQKMLLKSLSLLCCNELFTKYKVKVDLQKRRKITGVNFVKLGGNSAFSRTVHSAGLLYQPL